MSRLLVRILIGGALLITGMFIGVVGGRLPALASVNLFQVSTPIPTSTGDYCQYYETTLANNLHVSTRTLEQANIAALQQTINQLAKNGKITATEQLALEAALLQAGSDPCKNLPAVLSSLMSNPAVGQQVAAIHTTLVNAVAPTLNLSSTALENDLLAGKTIPQLAQQQHVSLSDVNAAYLKAVQSILAQDVKNQDITQDQANWLYSAAAQAVSQGQYPLLQGQ